MFMNKNLTTTNGLKVKDCYGKMVDEDAIKAQNNQLNVLLQKHYASQKVRAHSFYENGYRNCRNEFEELIKNYWEDIICNVQETTKNKLKQDYFTSKDKTDIPKGMCALKIEYQAYKNFKTSKLCGNYQFEEDGNNIYIVEHVKPELDENDYYETDESDSDNDDTREKRLVRVRRRLYNKIEDKKHDIAIDVRKEKMSRLSNLHKSGYDKKYVLYPETLVYFLKTLNRNNINDPEKRKMFLEFLWSDKLKIQTFNSEVISEIIDLVRFGRYTNINEWFDFLRLNKEHDLSPSVLFKCARKAQGSAFWWKADDAKEILSFAINYKWPDLAVDTQAYEREVNCFFGLLLCLFDNLNPDKKIIIQSAREIFDFVNKNMSYVKLPINEIKRYENGEKLLNGLEKFFVTIVPSEQNGKIETKIDYSGLFNDFIKDKFDNEANIKYNSLDELSKARENLIAEFIKYGKEAGIDISADVAKTLFFNARFVVRILYSNRTKEDIVKTPEDFKQYVIIINEMTKNKLPLESFYSISSPIDDDTVSIDDMLNFMSEYAETTYDMSFSSLYCYVYSKIKKDAKWTYDNIIKLLSYSKNFSKEDSNFGYDLRNDFLYLLYNIFKNADENVSMSFWQDVFDWINKNMPHVYFSKKLLEENCYCLISACKWNGIYLDAQCGKIKIKHDYGYVKERFNFFVWDYFRAVLKAEKFKSLSEIKSACAHLMDQFFLKHSGYITSICIKNRLRSELKIQLYNAYAMQDFIRSIEPGIIKSSHDLRDFISYVNSINLKKVSAFTNDIEYAADFVRDNSLSIDEAKQFLSCFYAKDRLYPSVLLKFCKKIKQGEKWNFTRIHSFLSFLNSSFYLSKFWNDDDKKQAEALFGLLNTFCSKDNMEWLSKEYDITLTEAVSYVFSVLSKKLYKVEFKNWFSKVNEFKNGMLLEANLTQMNLSLADIDLSKDASVILTKKIKKEKKINDVVNKLDSKNKNILKNKMKHWLQLSKSGKEQKANLNKNLKQEYRNIENGKNPNDIDTKNDVIKSEEKKEKEENKNEIEGGINNNNNNEITEDKIGRMVSSKNKKILIKAKVEESKMNGMFISDNEVENKDKICNTSNMSSTVNEIDLDKTEENGRDDSDKNTKQEQQNNENGTIPSTSKNKTISTSNENEKNSTSGTTFIQGKINEKPKRHQDYNNNHLQNIHADISQISRSNEVDKERIKKPKKIITFNWVLWLGLLAVVLIFSAVIFVALKFIFDITTIWALIVFPVVPIIIFLACTFVFKNKFRKIDNLNGVEIPKTGDNEKFAQEKSQENRIRLDSDSLNNPIRSDK